MGKIKGLPPAWKRGRHRLGERTEHFAGGPQGRSDKMWSESTFAPNASPGPWPWPSLQCSAPHRCGLLGKDGAAAIFFPSSKRSTLSHYCPPPPALPMIETAPV